MTDRASTIPCPGVLTLAALMLFACAGSARADVCCDAASGACAAPDGRGNCPPGYAPFGAGSCTPAPCPQPGACCVGNGCSFVSAGLCQAFNGTFHGVGAPCAPNPCVGACCNATTGACGLTVAAACGATFLGLGTACAPNPCAQPGACCHTATGACCFTTPSTCSGASQAPGVSCGPNPCAQPTACCNGSSGACTVALPGSACPGGAAPAAPASTTCTGVDCAAPAAGPTLQFSDRTGAAHLDAVHTAPVPSPALTDAAWETGGCAVGDFNNDGRQDLFVLGGPGAPDKLYLNQGDGTFVDLAAAWGVNRAHWGFGAAVGDYNGDGWLDIFVTSGGSGATAGQQCRHILYRNNGNGTFTDAALEAGVRDTTSGGPFDGFGCAWGDYDLDGRLDLAVAGWMFGSGGNRLFHNNGNGTFTDATAALGADMTYVTGFTPCFVDMNGDRYPELLWIGDFRTSRYFVNNRNGTFTDATVAAGVGLEANGMGLAVGDFNADGRPDWYVTSIWTTCAGLPQSVPGTGNMLYLNLGNHHFSEVGVAAGARQTGWGWGAVAADFRNTGRLDIAATNGWPGANYNGEFAFDPTCVFLNNGNQTFRSVAASCGVSHTGQGRGLVTFDYDNDGRQDLLIAMNGGPLTLYHNETSGPGRNYLRVFLNTRASHGLAPNGIGAHVIATINGVPPMNQHRWIASGSGYLSQSELSAHFGLGSAGAVDRLTVEWPDGTVTTRANVAANRTITISSCPGDWNADGNLGVQDIFDFLTAWFGGAADFDASGSTTVQDIFEFLIAWFSGCA